jgi:hypothetical protein
VSAALWRSARRGGRTDGSGQREHGAAVAGLRGDGCTGVPDSSPSFSLYEACEGHDSCYEHKPHGADGEGRKRCDDEFYDAMVRWCEANHGPWTIGRGRARSWPAPTGPVPRPGLDVLVSGSVIA